MTDIKSNPDEVEALRQKLLQAQADFEAGRFLTHQEVKEIVESWGKTPDGSDI